MLDALAREIALNFGLGASARALLDHFLADVDQEALAAKWRHQGYSKEVTSWLSEGANLPVTPEAFEEIYGTDRLQALADQLGLNARTCAEALAYAMPALVQGPGKALRADTVEAKSTNQSMPSGIPAIAALLGIILVIAWFASRGTVSSSPKPVVGSASIERAPRLSPSLFHATRTDAGIVYSAVLRDTTERKKLQMALADVEATGTIDVDLGVGRSAWLDSVKELVRDMPRGLELSISDNHVVIDGLSDRDMAQLVEILRDRVSGLTISLHSEEPDLGGVFAAMSHPTLEEWLDATNLMTVSFQSGGAQLAKTTEVTLKLATEALLRSRSKTPILIAGYTDSTGSDSGNRRLSQRRAQAVLEFMVSRGVDRDQLTAEGFGPDDPIASNLTPEGRAKNRRIEFRIKR